MQVSANLLWAGLRIKVGKNIYIIKETIRSGSQVQVLYKTDKGITKSRSYSVNDQVNIV